MPLCRVNDQAGRLVDDDDCMVLVQNGQRYFLGRWTFARNFNLLDDDLTASPQAERGLAIGVINVDVARIDRATQRRTADCRKRLGEKYIQTPSRLIGRYRKLLRPGWNLRRQKSGCRQRTIKPTAMTRLRRGQS
jgi:hypothetical protein